MASAIRPIGVDIDNACKARAVRRRRAQRQSNLSIYSQADLGDSCDEEVCGTGSPSQSSVNVTLPAAMEDYGSVTLRPGNPVELNVLGSLNESLSFWFELYQSCAFNQGGRATS